MMEKLKSAGGIIGGLAALAVIIAIPLILLKGMAEISVWALDVIPDTIGWATLAAIVLIPVAITPATRGLAAELFAVVSFVYLACTWLYAMAFTYMEWGFIGLVIGIMLMGIGVIFTGGLASVFAGEWTVLGNIALLLVLTVVTKVASAWLADLAAQRKLKAVMRERPPGVTILQNGEDHEAF